VAFFISENAGTILCRPEKGIYDPETGRRSHVQRGLYVETRRREAPLWARDIGVREFKMRHKHPAAPPGEWVAFVDTDLEADSFNWNEEEKAHVEQVLRDNPDLIEVYKPVPSPPWPNYGDLTTKQNLDLAARTSTPVETLIAYEYATRNDPKVIAEYEDVLATQQEIEQVVEA
jgi:hypothetical protein